MDAMLNLVNVLVREKIAGSGTAGSATDASYDAMMNLIQAQARERKVQEEANASLKQTLKVGLFNVLLK